MGTTKLSAVEPSLPLAEVAQLLSDWWSADTTGAIITLLALGCGLLFVGLLHYRYRLIACRRLLACKEERFRDIAGEIMSMQGVGLDQKGPNDTSSDVVKSLLPRRRLHG